MIYIINYISLFYPSLLIYHNKQTFRTCVQDGKMRKNRRFSRGRTKNQNVRSVFRAAYKLVHLYTNLKIKPLNQNPTKPSKIKHFTHFHTKISISHPISSSPSKINTFTHHTIQISTNNSNHFLPIQIQKSQENRHFHRLPTFH